MASYTELIDSIDGALQFLTANAATMPLKQLQRTRGEAIALGTRLLNDCELSREDFDRVYNMVLELDRVGY